jgi:hypothetical protein
MSIAAVSITTVPVATTPITAVPAAATTPTAAAGATFGQNDAGLIPDFRDVSVRAEEHRYRNHRHKGHQKRCLNQILPPIILEKPPHFASVR